MKTTPVRATASKEKVKTTVSAKVKKKAKENAEEVVTPAQTEDAEACYLVVAVSDIRGFTSLTARVNQFCQSRLNLPTDVQRLSAKYVKYMRETQNIARDLMTKHLSPDVVANAVIKSTGDGFMVAVRLAEITNSALTSAADRNRARDITWALLEGLRSLVDDARPKASGDDKTFAGKTYRLIKEHGSELGIALSDYKNTNADLYIAGGIALGTGFFSEKKSTIKVEEDGEIIAKPLVERDAFGHAANLAFRLCDKAGRDKTPSILLDRRVGTLVESEAGKTKKQGDHDYELRAYRTPLELKGIEENWCMCYQSPSLATS